MKMSLTFDHDILLSLIQRFPNLSFCFAELQCLDSNSTPIFLKKKKPISKKYFNDIFNDSWLLK